MHNHEDVLPVYDTRIFVKLLFAKKPTSAYLNDFDH